MAFHHLLLKWHPMVGCDFHMELTFTWPPVPAPYTPHLVGQRLAGFGGASMTGDDVLANNWNIIQRDSDIQYGIPHIPLPPFPPCVLALLWTALSGSKSYFGPSSVLGNGKPIAAALFVYVNPSSMRRSVPLRRARHHLVQRRLRPHVGRHHRRVPLHGVRHAH